MAEQQTGIVSVKKKPSILERTKNYIKDVSETGSIIPSGATRFVDKKLGEAGDTLEEVGLVSILLGVSFSVISSFVSIKFLLAVINSQKFHYFTPYCLIIGTFLIFESYLI